MDQLNLLQYGHAINSRGWSESRLFACIAAAAFVTGSLVTVAPEAATAAACPALATTLAVGSGPANLELGSCPITGLLLSDGTAVMTMPPAGATSIEHVLTTTGEDDLRVTNSGSGKVLVDQPSPGLVTNVGLATAGTVKPLDTAACSDGAYSYSSNKITSGISWYYNSASSPHSDSAVVGALNTGASAWYSPVTDCSPVVHNSTPALSYAGKTTSAADPSCSYDGISGVGWTNLGNGNDLAVTCDYVPSGSTIIETDVTLNTNSAIHWFFTTVPSGCSTNKYFDMAGAMAHERGHSYGMNHPPGSHNQLTMNAALLACTTQYETLGLADMNGIAGDYP